MTAVAMSEPALALNKVDEMAAIPKMMNFLENKVNAEIGALYRKFLAAGGDADFSTWLDSVDASSLGEGGLAPVNLQPARTDAGNVTTGSYYTMKALANGEGEILLYSEIGGSGGWFSDPGTTAEDFSRDLKALGNVKTINVRINSPGGEVFEGQTIYNLLAGHQARIVVHIDGLAASIASVIAMAGDEINIADNAMMMIHNAWGGCFGEAKDMRKTADVLEKVTGSIAGTYAKRSGVDLNKIVQMMDDETWMDAAEAKECGLVDNIVDNMNAMACAFDPKRFRNTPQRLVDIVNAMPGRERFADQFKRISASAPTRR